MRVFASCEGIANKIQNEDYSFFDEIKHLTQEADFSLINLEAPVVINHTNPIEKHGPNLRTIANAINSVKYAGFDMVTLANNHILIRNDSSKY